MPYRWRFYVTELWRDFQMWTWVPSRRRPPLWVRWFQLLPLLLKVKTFSLLFLFPCVIHYTVDGDVCHSSYSQVGLLRSRGRALLLRLLCGLQVEPFQNTRVSMRQPQGVEQDKTPTYSWPCNIFVHKTRQDITGGTGHNKKLTFTRQYKSGHDTFYKDWISLIKTI